VARSIGCSRSISIRDRRFSSLLRVIWPACKRERAPGNSRVEGRGRTVSSPSGAWRSALTWAGSARLGSTHRHNRFISIVNPADSRDLTSCRRGRTKHGAACFSESHGPLSPRSSGRPVGGSARTGSSPSCRSSWTASSGAANSRSPRRSTSSCGRPARPTLARLLGRPACATRCGGATITRPGCVLHHEIPIRNPLQLRRALERELDRLWTLAAPDPRRPRGGNHPSPHRLPETPRR
jgi:hypothetical protein